LEAIEALCAGDDMGDLLTVVEGLVDHNLLQVQQRAAEEQRFIMLETIREYASGCLQNSNEEILVRRAHAAYYLAMTANLEPEVMKADLTLWMLPLEQEIDNLRAAFHFAIEQRDGATALGLCGALW